MREYPDSPEEVEVYDKEEMRKILEDIIEEELPESSLNGWFIGSVYFVNMVDKIIVRLKKEA